MRHDDSLVYQEMCDGVNFTLHISQETFFNDFSQLHFLGLVNRAVGGF